MSIAELKQIISNLSKKPVETILFVVILIVIAICGFLGAGYFGKIGEQAVQSKKEFPSDDKDQRPPMSQSAQGENNVQLATMGSSSPITYIKEQHNYEKPKDDVSLPSADEITAEGRRAAPWHNEYGGVRRSYQRLLHWRDTINDPLRKDWIITEIVRVEKSYPVDVMRLSIDRWGYICVQHADCKKGYEPL